MHLNETIEAKFEAKFAAFRVEEFQTKYFEKFGTAFIGRQKRSDETLRVPVCGNNYRRRISQSLDSPCRFSRYSFNVFNFQTFLSLSIGVPTFSILASRAKRPWLNCSDFPGKSGIRWSVSRAVESRASRPVTPRRAIEPRVDTSRALGDSSAGAPSVKLFQLNFRDFADLVALLSAEEDNAGSSPSIGRNFGPADVGDDR